MKKIFILVYGIALLLGCEEQFDWSREQNNSDLIIVEAVLTNENKNHLIRLSSPYQEQNETPKPVSGATVVISTSTGIIPTLEFPAGSGLYITDSNRFVTNRLYTLLIEYNGKEYFAWDIQPPVEPLDPISYSEVENDMYTLDFNSSGTDPNYVKYYISWQQLNICPTDSSCQAKQIYYDLKNVDIQEIFKANQERVDFPAGTTIVRKKYSVSDNYREYLRGMLTETSWRGGYFDAFPANAASNLSEGATGYFAISTVVSDTTTVLP